MGDSSVSTYCVRIKKIIDQLENFGARVSDRNLMSHLLSVLSSKFSYIAITICHTEPFPSFMKSCSMLAVEEQELMHDQTKNHVSPHTDHSSFPQVLATDGTFQQSSRRANSSRGNSRGGRNQGRGSLFSGGRSNSGQ
ncbi:hypothetical protein Lser_V15G25754 [Lactuca serriola]